MALLLVLIARIPGHTAIAEKEPALEFGDPKEDPKLTPLIPQASALLVIPEPAAPIVQQPTQAPLPMRTKPEDKATRTPLAISASKVEKLAGAALELPEASEGRQRLRALLCMDAKGAVASVHILSNVSPSSMRSAQEQLKKWRYQSYEGVPACFTDSLRVAARQP